MFFEYTNDVAVQETYIKNYIAEIARYGVEVSQSPKEVLEAFHNGSMMPEKLVEQKKFVISQIEDIADAQDVIKAKDLRIMTRLGAIGLLAFALLFTTFKSVSLKDFIISVITGIGLMIVIGISMGIVSEVFRYRNTVQEMTFVGMTGLLYSVVFYLTWQTKYFKTYSRLQTICLVILSLGGPFFLFWLTISADMMDIIKIRDLDTYCVGTDTEEVVANIVLTGFIFHVLCIYPFLRRGFLKMKSLPKL